MRTHNNFITTIQSLYKQLALENTAEHWAQLVQAFAQASSEEAARLLTAPEIQALCPHLRALRASCEYEDEAAWARRLAAHPQPAEALMRYPNYERYTRIVDFEMTLLAKTHPAGCHHVLFIGGGPLPLTAILFMQRFGVAVDCLDINPQACRLAREVIQALGVAEHIRVRRTDILDVAALEKYDVVFLAALVGTDEAEKSRIVRHLGRTMRPGQIAVLRSAQGLKTLLYAPVDLADLAGFQILDAPDAQANFIQTEVVVEKVSL